MGHDERERKFEQALARHLRGDAVGARNKTNAHPAVANEVVRGADCLNVAMLAAFHESMLSSSETVAVKDHVAVCSRCQEILMQLEATDEIALEAEPQNILNARDAALSTGASDVHHSARQTPGLTAEPASALKAPQDISRGRGFKGLRWAAPAGAIAAGLLIWFVVRDNKVQTPSRSNNVQVAQEQPRDERLAAPRPLPASPPHEPSTETKQLNERRKDGSRVKQPAEESGVLRAPKSASSAAIANGLGAVASDASPRANVRQLPIESRNYSSLGAIENKPPEISSSQADVSVTAAAPPVSGDPPAQSGAPMATSPAGSNGGPSKAAKQKADADHTYTTTTIVDEQPKLATEQVATNDKLEVSPSLKKDSFENTKILAPKRTVQWRLLSGGRIERSSNGGVSWLAQNSGVNVELLAGSAPSDAVCWIVGRAGTVLRTTDGGGHWKQVARPNTGDIIGIQGMDAMHAIVYDGTAGVPVRLATNDGGVSWFNTNK
jgi:hypothetical protein